MSLSSPPPGVGKTHLAVRLGLKACARGHRTAFTTAASLIATLVKAQNENRLEEQLKLLVQPRLLIVDEVGYLPIDRDGANLFFHLVSCRCERGSILVTSNQSLSGWAGLRRSADRNGDPRQPPAELHDREHQGRELPAEAEAQSR